MDDSDQDYWENYTGFTYEINKQYMCPPNPAFPPDPTSPPQDWSSEGCVPPTDLIKVSVTVQWDEDKTYTTFGLVAQ